MSLPSEPGLGPPGWSKPNHTGCMLCDACARYYGQIEHERQVVLDIGKQVAKDREAVAKVDLRPKVRRLESDRRAAAAQIDRLTEQLERARLEHDDLLRRHEAELRQQKQAADRDLADLARKLSLFSEKEIAARLERRSKREARDVIW